MNMSDNSNTTVIVGISGGVDSAVAALLLQQQGYRVQGLHMTNWDEDDDYCEAARDYQDARKVCTDLDIPLHHVNFAREYRDKVFADFLEEYRRGRTPNPDVACNRQIKFGDCLEYAMRLGADKIATGHYARVAQVDGQYQLLKGVDHGKDQSYFLHAIRPEVLSQVLFPLGELLKPAVRKIANDFGLPNYARRDSTGICFIGERPFKEFLQGYIPEQPGNIETPEGKVIGRHDGLMFHTLGQRQGLAIGGLRDYSDEPWYVAGKDMARNVLLAVQGNTHPLLWSAAMQLEKMHWLVAPPVGTFRCKVKTRYRQDDVACELQLGADGTALVSFEEPVWAVTPGQYAVFYQGDICLGGAVIAAATAGASDPGQSVTAKSA
jgi:tRNA-specific 2-thiouridylase